MSERVALRLLLPGVVVTWIVTGFPDLGRSTVRHAVLLEPALSGMTSLLWQGESAKTGNMTGTIPCRGFPRCSRNSWSWLKKGSGLPLTVIKSPRSPYCLLSTLPPRWLCICGQLRVFQLVAATRQNRRKAGIRVNGRCRGPPQCPGRGTLLRPGSWRPKVLVRCDVVLCAFTPVREESGVRSEGSASASLAA